MSASASTAVPSFDLSESNDRTGLASVVTGIALLLVTFLAPLVAVVPYEAATGGPGHRRVPHVVERADVVLVRRALDLVRGVLGPTRAIRCRSY